MTSLVGLALLTLSHINMLRLFIWVCLVFIGSFLLGFSIPVEPVPEITAETHLPCYVDSKNPRVLVCGEYIYNVNGKMIKEPK